MLKLKRLIIPTIGGCIAMLSIMYLSWQHNSQCEIHCEGAINWGYWLLLGISGFIPVFILAILFSWAINSVKNMSTTRP